MDDTEGPVALVGSGEFLPVMAPVDAELLRGRPPRAAVVPTAAALEGEERLTWWLDLARRHYESLGVETVPVPVRTRQDADDPALAGLVAGAGLVYLSGGDPHHLASTLRGSRVWHAVLAAWHGGAALAGCSAGAMALTSGAPADLTPGGGRADRTSVAAAPRRTLVPGLAVVGHLAVIPHFDLLERRRPDTVEWFAAWQPPGTTLVGVEEDTAVVGDAAGWRVQGRAAVWVLGPGPRERFRAGDDVPLAPPRAAAGPDGP
jgi:cyanophycinase-like exopeptidase